MRRVDTTSNLYISKLLKQIASVYEVLGEDKFKIRAYQNAASGVEHLTTSTKVLWEQGKLKEIPGVGPSIAGHLDEYFKTGKAKHFDEVKSKVPKGMFELLGIQGIGAKTAFKLIKDLKISEKDNAIEKVMNAAKAGKIQNLEGFGQLKEKEILEALEKQKPNKETRNRMLLPTATEIAEKYILYMKENKSVIEIFPLGSLRRRVATIGDIDFAVSTNNPKDVINHFIKSSMVTEILNEGDVKASVLIANGARVDLMTENPKSVGALLQHFTGSKGHNIALRKFALEKEMSLSEHGIKFKNKLHEFSNEKDFYEFIGLSFIEPEIREDAGEIEACEKKSLPKLIKLSDIKGDLHTHTDFSDGRNTLEEMVLSAIEKGYEYVGISDHAPSVDARGEAEVEKIIINKKKEISELNNKFPQIKILFGYEVNILKDATLALPDKFLKELDYVIASIHTSFKLEKSEITKRLLNAVRNPYVTFIGHPTGRLLNQRDSIEADWNLIFDEAKKHNKILEINSQPDRLDLPDLLVKEALAKGVKFIINTDSHGIEQFDLMRYGVDIGRRGWLISSSVVNTLSTKDFLKAFLRKF